MAFHDRQYAVFAVLAATSSEPLRSASAWASLATTLQRHTDSSRGSTAVRSFQSSRLGKPIPFGRLTWSDSSHARWTHQNPKDDERRFVHVEAWAPSWSQCERDRLAPDFYFALANEALLGRAGKQLLFGQRVLAALAMDRPSDEHTRLKSEMQNLAAQLRAPLLVKTVRPWGLPLAGGGFTKAIQDMLIAHLFRPGDPHARPLDLDTFSEPWEIAGEA